MNCLKCEKNISAYIDNELSSRERETLEMHLKSCSACRTKLETMRDAVRRMKELPRIEGDLAERNRLIVALHEKIISEPAIKITHKPFAYKRFAFAGAMIIVLLLIVGITATSQFSKPELPPFELGNIGPIDNNIASTSPMEDIIFDRLVELIRIERLNATSHEVFSESVRGVFVYEPIPPQEGTLENQVEFPDKTG